MWSRPLAESLPTEHPVARGLKTRVALLTVHTVFATPLESYATAAVEVGNRGSERHCEPLLIPFYEGLRLSGHTVL